MKNMFVFFFTFQTQQSLCCGYLQMRGHKMGDRVLMARIFIDIYSLCSLSLSVGMQASCIAHRNIYDAIKRKHEKGKAEMRGEAIGCVGDNAPLLRKGTFSHAFSIRRRKHLSAYFPDGSQPMFEMPVQYDVG